MDFVGFINSKWLSTLTKKVAMLNDFTDKLGYQKEIAGKPNPMKRKEFANKEIARFIVKNVNSFRKEKLEKQVDIEELDFS